MVTSKRLDKESSLQKEQNNVTYGYCKDRIGGLCLGLWYSSSGWISVRGSKENAFGGHTYRLPDTVAFPGTQHAAGQRPHSAGLGSGWTGGARLKRNLCFKVIWRYPEEGQLDSCTYVPGRSGGCRWCRRWSRCRWAGRWASGRPC